MYYQVNKSYIASNLCENRDKPKMNCNGKCFLAKKLKAAEEKEKKATSEKLEKMPEITLFCPQSFFKLDYSFIEQLQTLHEFSYFERPYRSFLTNIFHPPRF